MYKNALYQVIKEKTNIRGYWKDEAGKLYRDNIKLVSYNRDSVKTLFADGELAVLYTNNTNAIIEGADGSVLKLKICEIFHVKNISSRLFKSILSRANGFTVYKNKTFNDYTIEIWS